MPICADEEESQEDDDDGDGDDEDPASGCTASGSKRNGEARHRLKDPACLRSLVASSACRLEQLRHALKQPMEASHGQAALHALSAVLAPTQVATALGLLMQMQTGATAHPGSAAGAGTCTGNWRQSAPAARPSSCS